MATLGMEVWPIHCNALLVDNINNFGSCLAATNYGNNLVELAKLALTASIFGISLTRSDLQMQLSQELLVWIEFLLFER